MWLDTIHLVVRGLKESELLSLLAFGVVVEVYLFVFAMYIQNSIQNLQIIKDRGTSDIAGLVLPPQ